MNEWYLVNLSSIYSVDKSVNYHTESNGELLPDYSLMDNNFDYLRETFGIEQILVKQMDSEGNEFKEISTGLLFGSKKTKNPLVINIANLFPASNEELLEYINYMQQYCTLGITRFQMLSKNITDYYNLYKPLLERVKKMIRFRMLNKIKSNIPVLKSKIEAKKNNDLKQRLSLIKGDK